MPKPKSAAEKTSVHPEKKIGPFAGGIGVAIWLNTTESDNGPRQFRTITINARRYYSKEDKEWRDASSYNPADLPALIFALEKAQEYVYETPLPGQEGEGSSEPTPF